MAAYMRRGKPVHLPARQDNTEFRIVRQYAAEFRGIAGYIAERLLADTCEACGSHDHVESHHIRKLNDLTKQEKRLPSWKETMIARQR